MGIDPILQHTAEYYFIGTRVNPLQTVLANAQSEIDTIMNVYNKFSFMDEVVAMSCPGVMKLDPDPFLKAVGSTVVEIAHLLDAAYIWPFYNGIVHHVLCRNMPRSFVLFWAFTSAFSLW